MPAHRRPYLPYIWKASSRSPAVLGEAVEDEEEAEAEEDGEGAAVPEEGGDRRR